MPRLRPVLLLLPAMLAACRAAPAKAPVAAPGHTIASFDAVDSWRGLERDTAVVREGTASGRWAAMDESPEAACSEIPHDWSAYNALAFWLHNEKKLDAAFMLILPSERKETEGADYYALKIRLGWTGWKRFLVPFGEMGRARQPLGWNHIDAITFTASGWGNTPHPEAVVRLDDFRLLTLPRTEGPRLTDEELFAAMDLDHPGLGPVRAAVRKRDLAAAKAAWLEHLKARTTPKWFVDWRDRPPPKPRPPSGGSPGWDYFSHKLALDWQGWKHIRLTKADFGESRKPIGWHWITYISITASGWGETPNADAVLYLDDVRLVGKDKTVSLGDFEAGLGHWRGGLTLTDEQAKSGTRSAKWHLMHVNTSIRQSSIPNDWTPFDALEFWAYAPKVTDAKVTLVLNSDGDAFAKADQICRHILQGHDLGPDIDWSADPTHYREWTYGINRFYHWRTLAEAYWDSGDEKYAREFADQLVDWVRKNPVPLHVSGNGSYTWRTIECGIRQSTTWPDSLYRVLGSKSFTPAVAATMTMSMVEHARHLMKWPMSGNWLTMESNGLGTLGILLPEFKEAAAWRKTAFDRMYAELDNQVYPDGAQIELTTGYHQVSLRNFLGLARTAKLNSLPLPADYFAKLRRMFEYNLYVQMPDSRTPGLNDGGMGSILWSMETALELYEDPLFEWAATGGARGQAPDHTSHHFPYAGQMVMRSGWQPTAHYLLMDAGPFGHGHQHEDKLSLVVHALGKVHIIDPGNYRYDSSPWRRYTIGTFAHNTLLVDGQPQRRRGRRKSYVVKEPLPTNTWLASDRLDYAAGQYDQGYGAGNKIEIIHRREVVFVKPTTPGAADGYWLVVDTLAGKGEHLYESLFHFDADEAEVEGTAVRTIDPTPNCLIAAAPQPGLSVRIVKGQTEPHVQGFIAAQKWRPSWKHPKAAPPEHGKREIPTAVFALKAKAPARIVCVIYPCPQGQTPAVSVEDVTEADGPVRARITLPDGTTDEITVARGAVVRRAAPGAEPKPYARLQEHTLRRKRP
ncbi:heparinase II/III family protein [bacterium]|nr:heparinase II/III family protein [bacterium]